MRIFSNFGYLEKLFFAKHLATLLKGGISLPEALQLLSDQQGKGIGSIAISVLASVENGQPLHISLAKHPEQFDPFFVSLIEVGEVSGTLEKSLDFLALKLSKEEALRKKVLNMLMYPSIVLATSSAVGAFVSFFVLPKLSGIFGAFDVQLPLATRMLLTFSGFIKSYGLISIVALFAIFILMRTLVAFFQSFKYGWHRIWLVIPFVGKVNKNAALASLFRDLGVMLQSGLPLERALRTESEVAENMLIRRKIRMVHDSVSQGKALGGELEGKEYTFFPTLVSRMISVGESSGKLEETFFYLADYFEEETDIAARRGAALLEPLLLVFIALVAGFVALSVVLPIYTLTGSIHN